MKTLKDLMKVMRKSTSDESMADVIEVVVELTCRQMATEVMVEEDIKYMNLNNVGFISKDKLEQNIKQFLNE